eukprot:363333-Chlamydomonas_euryale.AAC.6
MSWQTYLVNAQRIEICTPRWTRHRRWSLPALWQSILSAETPRHVSHTLAHHTKKRAGRQKGSMNNPRTGQNKTNAARSGGTSTERGRGRPKGSLNKPKHGQAAVQKPKAKTKANTKAL